MCVSFSSPLLVLLQKTGVFCKILENVFDGVCFCETKAILCRAFLVKKALANIFTWFTKNEISFTSLKHRFYSTFELAAPDQKKKKRKKYRNKMIIF